ncbi:15136_t:CDS:2 [Funneliformis mosseae]|uniref:15136_t:CDS:1 n=1 Tax=Funneliformis mosseae TaxID=27381 RepID=A0A9N9N9I5_FUNMO|nr:15136_t:CDS:2 [Funneliformis mosseae]
MNISNTIKEVIQIFALMVVNSNSLTEEELQKLSKEKLAKN